MRAGIKKRLVALLCIISMLCPLFGRDVSVRAEENTVSSLQDQGFTYWTLSDVCESDRTVADDDAYDNDTIGYLAEGSLNKTIFSAKINFPEGKSSRGVWSIGGKEDGTGLLIRTDATREWLSLQLRDGNIVDWVEDFTPEIAGVALRGNSDLTVSLSVEYTNVYMQDGVEYADLRLGVFFNGKLYNNQYITTFYGGTKKLCAPTSVFGKRVQFYCTDAYTIASNYLWDRERTFAETALKDEGYEYWTLSDVGEVDRTIADDDAANTDTLGNLIGNTLDETVFSAKIKFPTGKSSRGVWSIGGKKDGTGLLIRTDATREWLSLQLRDGNIVDWVEDFTPEKAGVLLRGNDDLVVSISVEYTNVYMQDGVEYADLRLGVFFNGKLYNNQYITTFYGGTKKLCAPTSAFGKKVEFYCSDAYAIASNHLWERELAELQLENEGYEYWTLSDVNEEDRTVAADGEYDADTAGHLVATSLDMTVFSAKINFPKEKGDFGRWYIGGQSDGVGFCFRTSNPNAGKDTNGKIQLNIHYRDSETNKITGAVIEIFDPAVAGAILRGNSDLIVSLAVKYEPASNGADGYTNLLVGVYFNGKLYNGQYYTVENVPSYDLAQRVYFYSPYEYAIASNHLWERAPEAEGLQEANLKAQGFEYWTLADMGVADQKITGDGVTTVYTIGNQIGSSLDKTVFTAKISFPDEAGDFGRFFIGGVKDGTGFCLRNYSTKADGMLGLNLHYMDPLTKKAYGVRLAEIYPGVAETTLRDNENLIVSLAIEYTKTYTQNGIEYADLKVGLYFDGKLYNDEYIFVSKVPTSVLARRTYFHSVNDYAVASNYLWAKSMSNYQAGLTELHASDFGLEDVEVLNSTRTGVYDNNTFDKTAVTLMLTFPEGQKSSLYMGATKAGLRLSAGSDGSVKLSYVNAKSAETKLAVLSPGKVGVSSLIGTNLKWQFVFLMNETWDNKTFLNVGVYVDGKLYGDSYFLLEDVDAEVLKRVIGIESVGGSMKVSNMKYEELSFCDFNILDTRLETIDPGEKGEGFKHSNYYDYETLDNTAFTGIYSFPTGGTARFVIGDTSFWHGIIFTSKEDGNVRVQHVDADNASTVIVDMTPEKAGVDALTGKDVKVRMTFDVMEISEEKVDVKLGIWINDKLYDGQYYVINDIYTSTLTRVMKLWAMDGPYEIKSVDEPADLALYGYDTNWRKTLGIK